MKNLANCTPREFLVQTNKIRKSVSRWLKLTDIVNIRKRVPDLPLDMSKEDRDKAMREQAVENLNAMLDAMLDEHPGETIEVLGLLCFIEPENLDNYKMSDLLGGFAEVIGCPEVINFFISLVRLGNLNISGTVGR